MSKSWQGFSKRELSEMETAFLAQCTVKYAAGVRYIKCPPRAAQGAFPTPGEDIIG